MSITETQTLSHATLHDEAGLTIATIWAEHRSGDLYAFEERGYRNPQTALDFARSWALPLEGDACSLEQGQPETDRPYND